MRARKLNSNSVKHVSITNSMYMNNSILERRETFYYTSTCLVHRAMGEGVVLVVFAFIVRIKITAARTTRYSIILGRIVARSDCLRTRCKMFFANDGARTTEKWSLFSPRTYYILLNYINILIFVIASPIAGVLHSDRIPASLNKTLRRAMWNTCGVVWLVWNARTRTIILWYHACSTICRRSRIKEMY